MVNEAWFVRTLGNATLLYPVVDWVEGTICKELYGPTPAGGGQDYPSQVR
jgi:hypothetical protein